MKKNLIFALWCGLCVCASAAFQYEIVQGSTSNGIKGSSFFVRITEGYGSLYVFDRLDSTWSSITNTKLLSKKADMSSFGYIDNKTGEIFQGDGTTITKYENKPWILPTVTQTGYKLGDFSVGDEIGIWLTDTKGNTGASILDKSNPINSGLVGRSDSTNADILGNDLFQLDFNNGWLGSNSIFFGVHGIEGVAPSGKPLPGVLVTLLLGGGVFGAMGMRKKRAQKA